jgi:uncharacterized protein (DUF1501 family)
MIRKSNDSRSVIDRRRFLKKSGLATFGGGCMANLLTQLRLMQAAAANGADGADVIGNDYKALVCIFLNGGMDTNNLVIPIGNHTQASYYQDKRSQVAVSETAIQNAGTAITPVSGINAGDEYGLNPSCVNMAQMFQAGEMALMCNVGTLAEQTTKSTYGQVSLPSQLFSHSNQVQEWMSSVADGPFNSGWGGRVADLLHATENPDSKASMLITAAGTNDYMVAPGGSVPQYSVTTNGAISLSGYGTNYANAVNPDGSYQNNATGRRLKAFERIMNHTNAHLLEDGYNTVVRRSRLNEALIGDAMSTADALQQASAPNQVDFDGNFATADNNVGDELKTIARLISGRKCLGNKRQIFFCNLTGFDTHQNINTVLPTLLSQLDSAIGAFNKTMKDLAAVDTDFSYDNVLGFQASDFNRTFTPNGSPGDLGAGTDHAWGSHVCMFGGAVDGKKIYGEFPDLTIGTAGTQDTPNNSRGRWIPSASVDQYAAVLSSWLGVSKPSGDLDLILPNLGRFADPFDPANNLNFIDPLA